MDISQLCWFLKIHPVDRLQYSTVQVPSGASYVSLNGRTLHQKADSIADIFLPIHQYITQEAGFELW